MAEHNNILVVQTAFLGDVILTLPLIQELKKMYPAAHIDVRDMTGTEDHYEVFVKSPVFAGLSRIERHQKVLAAFAAELKTGEVHALTIKTEDK